MAQTRNDISALELMMPIGYMLHWQPTEGGPDLNTAEKVADYLGFGTWKLCYGMNLALKTDVGSFGATAYESNGSIITVDSEVLYKGKPTIKIDATSNTGGFCYFDYIRLYPDTIYTTSLMVKSSVDFTLEETVPMHMWMNSSAVAGHEEIVLNHSDSVKNNTWTKIFITFKTPNEASKYYLKPFFYSPPNGIYNICEFKTEIGDAATEWVPAPEDTNGLYYDWKIYRRIA